MLLEEERRKKSIKLNILRDYVIIRFSKKRTLSRKILKLNLRLELEYLRYKKNYKEKIY